MNTQLLTAIANSVKDLYTYHGYEISKENLIRMSRSFVDIYPKLTEVKFAKFITEVEQGKHGVLYKMPTCILSMFQKFILEPENIVPKFHSGSDK